MQTAGTSRICRRSTLIGSDKKRKATSRATHGLGRAYALVSACGLERRAIRIGERRCAAPGVVDNDRQGVEPAIAHDDDGRLSRFATGDRLHAVERAGIGDASVEPLTLMPVTFSTKSVEAMMRSPVWVMVTFGAGVPTPYEARRMTADVRNQHGWRWME